MRAILTACGLLGIVVISAAASQGRPAHSPSVKVSEIDKLFTALSHVASEQEAKPIEEKIAVTFLHSNSPTVSLLMARAAASVQSGDADTARKLFGSVNDIAPDYAEAWHQRAILQAESGDDQGAIFCLQKTVTLNPRHFVAFAQLAGKLEEYGDKPGALRLYRKALALDPYFDDVGRKERALAKEVEGESL